MHGLMYLHDQGNSKFADTKVNFLPKNVFFAKQSLFCRDSGWTYITQSGRFYSSYQLQTHTLTVMQWLFGKGMVITFNSKWLNNVPMMN